MYRTLLPLLLSGCVALSAEAQAPVKIITLDEAVQLGLQNSKTLKADAARQTAAHAKTQQYFTAQIPTITLNSSYTRLSDNITPFTIPVPDGNGGFNIQALNPQILNQYSNRLSLQEILFTGGRARNFFASSGYLEKAISLDADKDRLEVQNNLVAAMLNLYKLQASQHILQANEKVLQSRQQDVAHFVQNGTALENDRLRADLAVTQVQTSLEDVKNAIETANFNLDVMLGLPVETRLTPDSASLFKSGALADFQTYYGQLNNRPDLQAAGLRREASVKQVQMAKGNYYPNLFLNGNYFYNRPNNRVFPPEDKFFPTWEAGLNLSWNISNLYTNRYAIQEAKANLLQQDAQHDQLLEGAQMELNASYNAYKTAVAKMELARKSVDQSEENRRVMKNRFDSQVIGLSDLLDADFLAIQSKLNLEAARADAETAYYKVLKSVGQ